MSSDAGLISEPDAGMIDTDGGCSVAIDGDRSPLYLALIALVMILRRRS